MMWPRVKVSSQCQEIKFWTPINRLPIAQAHIYVTNPLTVLRQILLNPECSGAEVVAFPCQVGVYEPGSTRSVSGAHKHNLAAVMWNYWACLVPTCVTRNCKKGKKFNSLATKECLYLITLTANLMVVNQWHVIQAEQPNGFIDEWHLKLLLENQCSSWITQAGTEPYQAAVPLLKATFCFSLQCLKSWVTLNSLNNRQEESSGPFLRSTEEIPWGQYQWVPHCWDELWISGKSRNPPQACVLLLPVFHRWDKTSPGLQFEPH